MPIRVFFWCVATVIVAFAPIPCRSQSASPSGTVTQAAAPLRIGAATTAVVAKIFVKNGQPVDAGQLLVELDCSPVKAEIDIRGASLLAADAAYERARNGPRPEEIGIGEASASLAQARADEAKAALDRATALRQGVTTTRAFVLEAERDALTTAAQLAEAKEQLALLRKGTRAEDLQESLAVRDAARASVEEAKARFAQCSIRAPVSGTVKVVVTLGQLVSTTVPVTLIELQPTN